MKRILIYEVTADELVENITLRIREEIKICLSEYSDSGKFYTRHEVADRLKITLKTLDNYCNKGLIQRSRIGNRVLFSSYEVEKAVKLVPTIFYKSFPQKIDLFVKNPFFTEDGHNFSKEGDL